MASTRQVQAAKRNIKRAQRASKAKKTITKLPVETRPAKARQRRGKPGRALEDRTRQQLYEVAKKKGVPGRSKMGKWDLIKAIRKTS